MKQNRQILHYLRYLPVFIITNLANGLSLYKFYNGQIALVEQKAGYQWINLSEMRVSVK